MSIYYPNVKAGTPPAKPLPGIKPKGRFSKSGRLYGQGKKGQVDPNGLENWEGASTFRDSRSPTGWIDFGGRVISGTDDRGVVLLPLRANPKKFTYYDGHQSGGGILDTVSKGLAFFDPFGAALELTGHSDLNRTRTEAGIATTATIVTAGGLGATTLAGLAGAGSELTGGLALLGSSGFGGAMGSPVGGAGPPPGPSARSSGATQQAQSRELKPVVFIVGLMVLAVLVSKK